MLPWDVEDLTFDENRFRGKVRLFPLPDLVMYPHVMQPLNIFEPRYVEMLNEALDSDGLIAMSVLRPKKELGPKKKLSPKKGLGLPGKLGALEKLSPLEKLGLGKKPAIERQPSILPYACLGKIVTHQRKENGQYNILLLGMRRVYLENELPADRSFRQAEVKLLDDFCLTENDDDRTELQTALSQRFQECLPEEQSGHHAMSEMLSTEIPLRVLTDLVSFAMPLDMETKCKLLGETDVDRRAWILLEAMDRLPAAEPQEESPRGFPPRGFLPPFSEN
jgi:Lon protease-like protein